jgi:Predicted membrane protein (DUF2207)
VDLSALARLLPNPTAAIAVAVVGFVCWFVLLGVLVLATRAGRPRPGPPADPARPGAESPALVDLLTGGWRLCEEAAAATVLDLAARRVVAVEEVGPELSLVRLRHAEVTGLTAYEQRVYEHLRRLARDGVVATGALAEGTRQLKSWWKAFTTEVIEESRARGLTRPRWTVGHHSVLSTAAFVPAGLAAFATFVTATDDRFWPAVVVAGVSYTMLVSLVQKLNGERGTDLGVAAAGRWLGLREHLAAGAFGEQPAAAVTVWGRPLAYAAALGLAPRAVASLPIASPADDRRAWSDYGGMWHVVDVRYRARGLFGAFLGGRTALSGIGGALLIGLATFAVAFVAVLGGGLLLDGDLGDPVAVARVVAVLVAAVPLLRALADLFARAPVQGQVVRRRRYQRRSDDDNPRYHHWIALDTGTSRTLYAYGIDEDGWGRLQEGDIVTARVGRWLGRIYAVEVVTPSRHRSLPGTPTPGPDPV